MKKLIDFIAKSKGLKTTFDIKKDLEPHEYENIHAVKNKLLRWFSQDKIIMWNYLFNDDVDESDIFFFILYKSDSFEYKLFIYGINISLDFDIVLLSKFIFLNKHYYMEIYNEENLYRNIDMYKHTNIYFENKVVVLNFDKIIFSNGN